MRKIIIGIRYRVSEFERLSQDEKLFLNEMSQLSEDFLIHDDDDDDGDTDDETSNNGDFTKTCKTFNVTYCIPATSTPSERSFSKKSNFKSQPIH